MTLTFILTDVVPKKECRIQWLFSPYDKYLTPIKSMTNLSDPTDKGAPRESNQQRVQVVIGISTGAI